MLVARFLHEPSWGLVLDHARPSICRFVSPRVARLSGLVAATLGVAACVPSRSAAEPERPAVGAADLAEPARPRRPPEPLVESGTEAAARAEGPAPAALSASRSVLSRTALIRAVVRRNPEVDARRQALRAARARRSQVSALDDPEVAYGFAPMTIGSGSFGQTVQVSQRLPWPGKRASLGASAEAESEAARDDVRVTELDLALEASLSFDDYYLVHRSLEVNDYHQHLLRELKSAAEVQLSTGRASLQDPLQAEVELSRLVQQSATLHAERTSIAAVLNGLLHRAPTEALPPPDVSSSPDLEPPASEPELWRIALSSSPELRGLRARERAAESLAQYAEREYYPDFTLMASYNTMVMPDARLMLGIAAPIPLQRGRRGGMLEEAGARSAEARAQAAREVDRIRVRVSVARQQVLETIRVVKIIEQRVVPAAKAQVAAARVDFAPGRTSFLAVVEGEKNLRNVELSLHSAVAELGRRRARLDRALGRLPFVANSAEVR